MVDVVDQKTRSRMMSGIRGTHTKPEMLVREGLHRRGLRYRLHGGAGALPGKPDLVFPKYKTVVFVHGCFWHMHDCPLFKWPSTRTEFWRKKITANRARDERQQADLRAAGWRAAVVWECALKGASSDPSAACDTLAEWIRQTEGSPFLEVRR